MTIMISVPGLQEYIEAISFWQFLKEKTLISVAEVEEGLRFIRSSQIKVSHDLASCVVTLNSTKVIQQLVHVASHVAL